MIEAIVERYVKARDKKAELKAEYEGKVAALDEAMKKCEAFILDHFNKTGQTSAGTPAGTAYVSKVTSATVADWDTVFNWIRTNGHWHFLDHKVNKTAVADFKAANEDLPPGVNWREEKVVRIRAS
jgi:hypothetical protein